MEIEKEIEINYPDELFEYLTDKADRATFKMQKEAFEEVKNWIMDRKFVALISVDVEPREYDEP